MSSHIPISSLSILLLLLVAVDQRAMSKIIPCVVFAVLLAAYAAEAQIGCGEAVNMTMNQTCSDWQCSRVLGGWCVRGVDEGESCTETSDCYLNLECSPENHTCVKTPKGSKNAGIGFVAAFIAVACFGSSFVPVKRFKKYAGDGVFAQFCMCFGRFMFGCGLMLTRSNKQFYPMAALGGMFWSGGNAISVPIIQCIGMGLGIAIWGTTNMLLGWASGKFGWWGVKVENPERPWLSYLSVVFSFISIILFLFVEPHHKLAATNPEKESLLPGEDDERKKGKKHVDSINGSNGTAHELENGNGFAPEKDAAPAPAPRPTIADMIGKTKARVIGVCLALVAGALFGLCMDPAQHMMSNYEELTRETDIKYTPFGFDYVFSFNCGAIAFSFFYLSIYQFMQMLGFRPTEKYFDKTTHEKIILPCFANGIIGSCGSAAWFFANQNLGLIISFPIIGAGPGIVSALWGVLVFKEIKGMKNFVVLISAFVAVIAATLCSGYSNVA